MKEVTNLNARPVVLEDGILAAAGTPGSTKVVDLSEAETARLGESIVAREVQLKAVAPVVAKSDTETGRRGDAAK